MASTLTVEPHVATKIEEGAILYSSWGYDQTNIDFYYVTRATKSSAWIVPMSSRMIDGSAGFMSEHVVAGEPQYVSTWCECRHRVDNHSEHGCRGAYGDECPCSEARHVPNVPEMHRIRRWSYGDDSEMRESLTLTSYSSASLWEGSQLYASHYA